MKITDLRVYKPNGEMLEFKLGEKTIEGEIEIIDIFDDGHQVSHPCVWYVKSKQSPRVEAHFNGFPYSYRSVL